MTTVRVRGHAPTTARKSALSDTATAAEKTSCKTAVRTAMSKAAHATAEDRAGLARMPPPKPVRI